MYGRGRPGDRVIVRDSTTEPGFVAFWVREGRVAAAAALDEPRDVRSAKILAENRIEVPDETLRFAGTDLRRLVRQLRSPDTRRDIDVTG